MAPLTMCKQDGRWRRDAYRMPSRDKRAGQRGRAQGFFLPDQGMT